MMKIPSFAYRVAFAALSVTVSAAAAFAQNRPVKATPLPEPSIFESIWFYVGFLAIAGLVGLMLIMRKKEKKAAAQPSIIPSNTELKLTYKEPPSTPEVPKPRPQKKTEPEKPAAPLQFAALPVSGFTKLSRTSPFPQLPTSAEKELLEAIELTNEDSEVDLTVRTRALKLLSNFKTSNSISAISQIALYDLSSKLRADAVAVLAEIDHESVFETIVTACADPTREVRAAAARALSKISFDRGQAWARIIESGDIGRMRHAARCAIDSDLVMRYLDRLINTDRSIAYEAFALTALLVRSGETEPVLRAIAEHKIENVKLSLLHVLQTIKEDRTFDELSDLLNRHNLPASVADKLNEVRSCVQMSHA